MQSKSYEITREAAFYTSDHFSESVVTAWLFFNQESHLTSLPATLNVTQGPGELLKWKAFNQSPDCFLSKISHEKKPKKKVLICHSLLNDRPPSRGELGLMSALVKYYEVYLWQETNLSTATPLSCGDDFWRLRETIQPATAAAINQFFDEQQMAADEWLVLDQSAYDQRWGIMKNTLDLGQVDLSTAEKRQVLLKSVDYKQITIIELLAPRPEVLQFICRHFKNLKILTLAEVSASWLETNIEHLENSSVETIELFHPITKEHTFNLSLEKNYGIKTLVLNTDNSDSSKVTAEFTISAEETLTVSSNVLYSHQKAVVNAGEQTPEHLTIEREHKKAFPIKKLQLISIANMASYKALFAQGENRNVTGLIINARKLQKECSTIFANLARNFPCLLTLVLANYHDKDQLILDHPYLESCLIHESEGLVIVNEVPKLHYLYLESSHFTSCPIKKRLPALKRLSIPLLKSGTIPYLGQLTPALEFFSLHRFSNFSVGGSAELILGDSVKEVLLEEDSSIFLPGNLKIHGGKNLRQLTLDVFTDTLHLELAESVHLRKLITKLRSGQGPKDFNCDPQIKSLDIIPSSLLLMDFHAHLPVKFQKLLPTECVSNVLDRTEARRNTAKRLQGFSTESTKHKEIKTIPDVPRLEYKTQPQRAYTFCLPEDEISPDAPTGQPGVLDLSETIAQGRLQYSIKSSKSTEILLSERDYRIQIYNRIEIDADEQITFKSNSPFLTVHDYQDFAKPWLTGTHQGKHTHKGELSGNLQPDKNYPLALNAPPEDQLSLYAEFEPVDAQHYFKVGLHRDSSQENYYVRLLPSDETITSPPPTKVTLHYFFTPQRDYRNNHWSTCLTRPEEKPTFTAEQQTTIASILITIPELKPILDPELALAKKLSIVIDYLTQFDPKKALVSPHPHGSLKQLFDIIQQRCGVCRQRSQAFMLIAHFLGAEAQMVVNGVHSYCEIRDAASQHWRSIELGGGDMEYLNDLSTPEPKPKLKPLKPQPIENPTEPFIRQYLSQIPEFSWSDFTGPALSLLADADHAVKPLTPILITIPEKTAVASIRRDFFNPQHLDAAYLFIDKPADFTKYWSSYTLQADGSRQLIPGPLQDIFASGGTLLINWTNFSSRQQLYYQSLWANLPRWQDKPISSRQVKIIGLLTDSLSAPPSFMAGCKVRRLPQIPSPVLDAKMQETSHLTTEPHIAHFDVFKSKSWQELLVADIAFLGKKSQLIEGFFYQAITAAQKQTGPYQLLIHQPPQDSEFFEFLEQITLEKRYFFNGRFHPVPDNFLISTTDTPLNPLPEKLPFTIWPPTAAPSGLKRCYLHANNWYSLYQQIFVDSDGGLRSINGRLAELTPEAAASTLFYVTQSIPNYELQQLANVIASKYPEKHFQFQMASTYKTPLINTEQLPEYVQKKCSLSLTTNDPNFLAEKLQQLCSREQETLIIDLTPAMDVTDLLVAIRPNPGTDHELNFILEKKFLLTALAAGKTVILKGQLSTRLQQELAPLFSSQPYLECNGQAIPIKGRLLLVQPPNTTVPFYPLSFACYFNPDDYLAMLLASDRIDEANQAKATHLIKNLLQLFSLARIPHRGSSMPTNLGINFTRLLEMKRLLLAVKQPSDHRHNQMKGLMLHDYVKGSEEYALLNVLFKFYFDDNKDRPLRYPSFQRLQQSISASNSASSNFAWRLLNTCNGHILRQHFQQPLIGAFKQVFLNPRTSLLPYWTQNDSWPQLYKTLEQGMAGQASASLGQAQPVAMPAVIATELIAPPETKQITKMQQRLTYLVQTAARAKVVVIKGEPGVGKTYYLEQLAKNPAYSCFVGLDNIEPWLMASCTKPKLLLLDEANTLLPGMLDLLDGIHRRPACIVYQGRSYTLSPQHKILAAVNPEYFSGRYYHNLLRNGETVLAPLPDITYLENYLVKSYGLPAEIAKSLVAGAELFKRYQPLQGYSFRDLQNLAQRYQVVCSQTQTNQQSVYATLYGEFVVAIPNRSSQQQFDKDLRQQLMLPALSKAQRKPFIIKHLIFPAEMQDAHLVVSQALDIRRNILAKTDAKATPPLAYKRGLLLQGAAGIGKKLLCQHLLQEKGLSAISSDERVIDPSKHYLEVTAGEANFRSAAVRAFNLGAILVVNQLNFLSVDDERFLGGLLMGHHEDRLAEKPGFLLVATQNPNSELGGGSLSPALCNRMQILSLPPYAHTSWTLLAKQKLSSEQEAQQFTQAFWHPQQPYPKTLTGHDFFACLEKEAARLAATREKYKRDSKEEVSSPAQVKKRKTQASGFFEPLLLPSAIPSSAALSAAPLSFFGSSASSATEKEEAADQLSARHSKRKREEGAVVGGKDSDTSTLAS